MLRLTHRARGTVAATAVAAGALLLGACNPKEELLSPQQPGVISPSSVANATAAEALYAGALDRWKNAMINGGNNTEALFEFEALFTDEVRSADTFSQRNDADQRVTQSNDQVLTPIYNTAQQARGRARDAINSLLAFDPVAGRAHIGEMYLAMGATETVLSEAFCNGVPYGETVDGKPVYGTPISAVDGAKLAITRFDSALVYLNGTDQSSAIIKNAVLIAKGRAQIDVGDFAGAATTVAPVPTSFQYNWNYSITTADNGWWVMGPAVKRYNAGDSVSTAGIIQNAIPFAQLNDPRVVTQDTRVPAEDRKSDFIQVNNWNRDDPVPPLSGIDARLIEAEAKLNAGDIVGMTNTLNALRSSPQTIGIFSIPAMAPLTAPADKATATKLFFREKALWQYERGWRLGDLRRLVRQYGFTQDKVYPSGAFSRNTTPSGTYGTEVAFPVPDAEKTNPLFTGCIDTNA
jgi:starch-binding outer membrane protein, SusD/RagB family